MLVRSGWVRFFLRQPVPRQKILRKIVMEENVSDVILRHPEG